MIELKITQELCGQRLDKSLHRFMGAAPKTFIYKMIRKKNIVVNGKKAEGSQIVQNGDVVTLYLSDETAQKFMKSAPAVQKRTYNTDLNIIFETNNIIILNKQAGLLTQPDSGQNESLVDLLRQYIKNTAFAPVVVNRLDRNTSGIVLCAKNITSAQILSALIHNRKIDKYYLAVVHGKITQEKTLTGFHLKDKKRNLVKITLQKTQEDSKEVLTKITPLKFDAAKNITLLKIELKTGRSHQIRAHLSSIGHPLVGDKKYGGANAQRQMLHASEITFGEVSAELCEISGKSFTAPLPADMAAFFL